MDHAHFGIAQAAPEMIHAHRFQHLRRQGLCKTGTNIGDVLRICRIRGPHSKKIHILSTETFRVFHKQRNAADTPGIQSAAVYDGAVLFQVFPLDFSCLQQIRRQLLRHPASVGLRKAVVGRIDDRDISHAPPSFPCFQTALPPSGRFGHSFTKT